MIQKIINEINDLSGNYSGYEIFSDWIKATAISISNSSDLIHDKVWEKREKQYLEIVHKHGQEKMKSFARMTALLVLALEKEPQDVLGKIYMDAGLGSKQTGQFFTPFHVSKMIADMTVDTKETDVLEINEPSCGGGGMIIAQALSLKEKGIDYQKVMRVTAQDLDWKGVYMAYVQLSLLGIDAAVIQGDTLAADKADREQIFYTPKRIWNKMLR
jgi:type I restriction-modification system DNA methylase subunit